MTASPEPAREDRARGARYSQESSAFHEVTGFRPVTRVVPREKLSSLWG
ncbi:MULTISPECIES: hypothetical protein [Carboxydocella]|nr:MULTISPECIES: hypothetical protein [Carboxydocella]